MVKKTATFYLCTLIAILLIPSAIFAQASAIQGYKINYLSNGKIKLSNGKLNKIFDLADYISGCKGNLYDPSSKETIESAPSVDIVSISKKSRVATQNPPLVAT